MTPQERLSDAMLKMSDEAIGYVAVALRRVVVANVGNHGFRPESTRAFEQLGAAVDVVLSGEGRDG
jgi:hypothetical protein